MSLATEFKDFVSRGNVVDLAVGVIIGAAFGKIVDSLVKDIIMPIAGKVLGGLDFSNLFLMLGNAPADFKSPLTYDALTKAGVPLFAYGNFITVALNFVINSHKPEEVSLLRGLHYGAFTGLFFCMLTMGINYLYQRRSIMLWLIDGFYMILGLGIAGMILGAWR